MENVTVKMKEDFEKLYPAYMFKDSKDKETIKRVAYNMYLQGVMSAMCTAELIDHPLHP